MKKLIFRLILCFQIFSVSALAQEKFDIVSLNSPSMPPIFRENGLQPLPERRGTRASTPANTLVQTRPFQPKATFSAAEIPIVGESMRQTVRSDEPVSPKQNRRANSHCRRIGKSAFPILKADHKLIPSTFPALKARAFYRLKGRLSGELISQNKFLRGI